MEDSVANHVLTPDELVFDGEKMRQSFEIVNNNVFLIAYLIQYSHKDEDGGERVRIDGGNLVGIVDEKQKITVELGPGNKLPPNAQLNVSVARIDPEKESLKGFWTIEKIRDSPYKHIKMRELAKRTTSTRKEVETKPKVMKTAEKTDENRSSGSNVQASGGSSDQAPGGESNVHESGGGSIVQESKVSNEQKTMNTEQGIDPCAVLFALLVVMIGFYIYIYFDQLKEEIVGKRRNEETNE